jgi:hypothetical protein
MVTHHAGGPETFTEWDEHPRPIPLITITPLLKKISAERRNPFPTKLVYTPTIMQTYLKALLAGTSATRAQIVNVRRCKNNQPDIS